MNGVHVLFYLDFFSKVIQNIGKSFKTSPVLCLHSLSQHHSDMAVQVRKAEEM